MISSKITLAQKIVACHSLFSQLIMLIGLWLFAVHATALMLLVFRDVNDVQNTTQALYSESFLLFFFLSVSVCVCVCSSRSLFLSLSLSLSRRCFSLPLSLSLPSLLWVNNRKPSLPRYIKLTDGRGYVPILDGSGDKLLGVNGDLGVLLD